MGIIEDGLAKMEDIRRRGAEKIASFRNPASPSNESSTQVIVSTLETRIIELEEKIDEVVVTTRRLYKIFLWTAIATVAAIVLPLIFAAFTLPSILADLNEITNPYGDLLE